MKPADLDDIESYLNSVTDEQVRFRGEMLCLIMDFRHLAWACQELEGEIKALKGEK